MKKFVGAISINWDLLPEAPFSLRLREPRYAIPVNENNDCSKGCLPFSSLAAPFPFADYLPRFDRYQFM
jgi:hypothetical protein